MPQESKPSRARELALTSRAAYVDFRNHIDELKLDSWQPFGRAPVEGFVGSTGKKAVLAFSGARHAQTDFDTLTWLDKAFTEWTCNKDAGARQFHSGRVEGNCLNHLRDAWPEITQLLTDHGAKDKKLWIAGHGFGGALAALAGAVCHWEHDLEAAGVYTFGAPRVADEAFARHYPVSLLRYEYRNDIVPHLPPSAPLVKLLRALSADIEEALDRWFGARFIEMNFVPIGRLNSLDRKGRAHRKVVDDDRLIELVRAMIVDPSQLLQDHWIDSYCAVLDASA